MFRPCNEIDCDHVRIVKKVAQPVHRPGWDIRLVQTSEPLLGRSLRNLGLNIAIPASHRWQICFTREGSWTLSSVAA